MGQLAIRDADLGDLRALQEIFRRASLSNESDRPLLTEHPEFLELSDTAIREGRTRVAVMAETAVGFATLAISGSAAELEDLFVDPAWMRHGVATALVADAKVLVRANGAARIEVDANDHALRFYESAGFLSLGRIALPHGFATRMAVEVDCSSESRSTG